MRNILLGKVSGPSFWSLKNKNLKNISTCCVDAYRSVVTGRSHFFGLLGDNDLGLFIPGSTSCLVMEISWKHDDLKMVLCFIIFVRNIARVLVSKLHR